MHRVALGALAVLLGLFEGPSQIALVVALVTTALTGRLRGYRPGWVEGLVLLWVAAGYVGLFESETPRISSAGALAPLHVLAILVGARAIRGLRAAPYAGLFLGGLAVNAGFGVMQVWVWSPPLDTVIVGRPRTTGLIDPDAPHRLTMATGLFYNRLKLAHMGVLGVGLGLLGALQGHLPRGRRLAAGAAAAVIGLGVLLTFRRAAPMAHGVGGMALLAVRGHWRGVLGAAGAVVVLMLGLAMTEAGQARVEVLSEDMQDRLQLFSHGLEVWREHPLVGVGHGDYDGVIAARVTPDRPGIQLSSPHNQALNALAETGGLGALGLFGALALGLLRLLRRLRDRLDPVDAHAFTTLVTLLVLGLVHAVLHHPSVAIAWWLALGASLRTASAQAGLRGPSPPS